MLLVLGFSLFPSVHKKMQSPAMIAPPLAPPLVGEVMSSLVNLSVLTSKTVKATSKLTSWDSQNEDWERAALRRLMPVVFSELITFSTLFGFLLSFVVHERTQENKRNCMMEACRSLSEHYEGMSSQESIDPSERSAPSGQRVQKERPPEMSQEKDGDKENKRKRKMDVEEGSRVMEKYLVHGGLSELTRHVPFSQSVIGFWDTQYKKHDFRKDNRQNFLYKLNFLICDVAGFARSRGWIGSYTPKRICMSLIAECGKLSSMIERRREGDLLSSLPRHVKVDIARGTADMVVCLLHLARELGMTVRDFHSIG